MDLLYNFFVCDYVKCI